MTRRHPLLYPPVWFGLQLALAWAAHRVWPTPLSLPSATGPVVWGLMGTGVSLVGVAIATFARHRTPVLPFRDPSALLDHGVFRWSRNPIYLGEAIFLAGWALRLGDLLPWLTLPLFLGGLTWGPIAWEEAALRKQFGAAYEAYCRRTRRWI